MKSLCSNGEKMGNTEGKCKHPETVVSCSQQKSKSREWIRNVKTKASYTKEVGFLGGGGREYKVKMYHVDTAL